MPKQLSAGFRIGRWCATLRPVLPGRFLEDGALTYYRDVALAAMECGDPWHWAIRLKGGPGHLIGSISLLRHETNNRGFWMGLPWQRRDFMSEAVVAANDYWFDVLGFQVLRAPKAIANSASRRISEQTGMRVVATLEQDFVSGRLPTELWEITADEWHARRA